MRIYIIILLLVASCDQSNPYAEGMHWDYSIHCMDGFLWRHTSSPNGYTPCLHSDGTQMRCGETRH